MFNSLFSSIEGYTSCTQVTTSNCSDCTTAKIDNTTSPCYWNQEEKKCGSFKDNGYCGKSDPTCCNSSPNIKGGCEGTQFQCCPDGITAKQDIDGTNCPTVKSEVELPNMEDNNSNILSDIQSLQTIEKQLFNNLEENTGLTTDQQQKIIEKINDISKMRINLYQTLSGVNNFFQNALTTTKGSLSEQAVAIDIVEKELNKSKLELKMLQEEKNNKIRIVEINDYYGQKYEEHSYLMKIMVVMLIPILILSIFLKKGLLPEPVFYILVVIIAVIGGVFISKALSSILTRDSMNYQEYNWAFDHSAAPVATSVIEENPWLSDSPAEVIDAATTCVGDECCLNGLVFDSLNNTCAVSIEETFVNNVFTKPIRSGFHKSDVVLGEPPRSAEGFVNYNAF